MACIHTLPLLIVLRTLSPQMEAAKKTADREHEAAVARMRAELGSGSEELQAELEKARKAAADAETAGEAKQKELSRWAVHARVPSRACLQDWQAFAAHASPCHVQSCLCSTIDCAPRPLLTIATSPSACPLPAPWTSCRHASRRLTSSWRRRARRARGRPAASRPR